MIAGLLTAVLLTAVITDALKDGLGFPRPDFYARCFGDVANPAVNPLTLSLVF
jgi:diacylglycerol diphosphate phosphatase/phosphatidate phosphatase